MSLRPAGRPPSLVARSGGEQRLFILAEPRSGSTWLMETLNSHPRIRLESEILNPVHNPGVEGYVGGREADLRDCLGYLEKTLRCGAPGRARFHGCKVLLNQLTHMGEGFLDLFLDFYRDAEILYLQRANLVAAEISLQLAHAQGLWHVTGGREVALRRIRLSPSQLVTNLEASLRCRERTREALAARPRPCLPLTYEEVFRRREEVLAGILAFLGLAPGRLVYSSERKGNPFRAREVIENFEEISDHLAAHPALLQMLVEA